MNPGILLPFALLAGLLAGCASPDRVVFVTSTELGIGADGTAGHANLGYTRREVVTGPAYVETGALPPVYGALSSSGSFFTPNVDQAYATGNAANLVSRQECQNNNAALRAACHATNSPEKPMTGKRRIMIFGTATNLGFSIESTAGVPRAINLGYKRKEFSVLPLREEADRKDNTVADEYGSLLASVQFGIDRKGDTTYHIGSMFATGQAADNLAQDPVFAQRFGARVHEIANLAKPKQSEGAQNTSSANQQQAAITQITQCVYGPQLDQTDEAGTRLDALATASQNAGMSGGDANELRRSRNPEELQALLDNGGTTLSSALSGMAASQSTACVQPG